MLSVIAVVVWQGTPFFTMSFLAGLQAIPKELYEAAEIDGASVLQQFTHITLPRLHPIFITAVMLSAILTSSAIQFVLILTNGGPADRTMIFSVLSYHLALGGAQRLGMGAAVSLIFFPDPGRLHRVPDAPHAAREGGVGDGARDDHAAPRAPGPGQWRAGADGAVDGDPVLLDDRHLPEARQGNLRLRGHADSPSGPRWPTTPPCFARPRICSICATAWQSPWAPPSCP